MITLLQQTAELLPTIGCKVSFIFGVLGLITTALNVFALDKYFTLHKENNELRSKIELLEQQLAKPVPTPLVVNVPKAVVDIMTRPVFMTKEQRREAIKEQANSEEIRKSIEAVNEKKKLSMIDKRPSRKFNPGQRYKNGQILKENEYLEPLVLEKVNGE